MKPHEMCKRAGLKGLAHLARIVKRSVQTLNRYAKNYPEQFDALVIGAAVKYKEHIKCKF